LVARAWAVRGTR